MNSNCQIREICTSAYMPSNSIQPFVHQPANDFQTCKPDRTMTYYDVRTGCLVFADRRLTCKRRCLCSMYKRWRRHDHSSHLKLGPCIAEDLQDHHLAIEHQKVCEVKSKQSNECSSQSLFHLKLLLFLN